MLFFFGCGLAIWPNKHFAILIMWLFKIDRKKMKRPDGFARAPGLKKFPNRKKFLENCIIK